MFMLKFTGDENTNSLHLLIDLQFSRTYTSASAIVLDLFSHAENRSQPTQIQAFIVQSNSKVLVLSKNFPICIQSMINL